MLNDTESFSLSWEIKKFSNIFCFICNISELRIQLKYYILEKLQN